MLPVALGVVESAKWSCGKVIRQIVDLCTFNEGSSELVRQCKKLRHSVTTHIYHILKVSESLNQYFPTGSRREDEKEYDRLLMYLRNNENKSIRVEFL